MNILSELTVDEIPKGKESEYLTKDQSAELVKRLKSFVHFITLMWIWWIVGTVAKAVGQFVDFPQSVDMIFSIVVYGGLMILFVFGAIKYLNLKKFAKMIGDWHGFK